jgi:DNA-binding MarR family transcriptional regulator
MNFNKLSVHDTPDRSPGFLLWHISTSWRSSIERVLKPIGLTHPQFVVLATLGWLTRKGDLVTQAAVGKMAGLDPNTTSQIIKGLEKKGLIKRAVSADARAKNPVLTPEGSKILTQALPAIETADGQFFNSLSDKEMEHTIQIFQKLGMVKKQEK